MRPVLASTRARGLQWLRRSTYRPTAAAGQRLRVLQSFPEPLSTTNPYLVQLRASLPPEVDCATFTWRRALTARYDILHVHWPEVMLRSSSGLKTWRRRVLFTLLLVRLRCNGSAVVRTRHNLAPHEQAGAVERVLVAALERMTALQILINDAPPPDSGATATRIPAVTILHGHYRDWYRTAGAETVRRGTLVHAGLVRPYKNVDGLIEGFAQLRDDEARLRVVGACADPSLRRLIEQAAAADTRITCHLQHLDDAELVAEVARAELVVVPHRQLHNSGTALMALSLGRPVLLPEGPAADALAGEVGPGWVVTFAGTLSGASLATALDGVRTLRTAQPDLSAREWPDAGRRHAEAYRQALARAGRRACR